MAERPSVEATKKTSSTLCVFVRPSAAKRWCRWSLPVYASHSWSECTLPVTTRTMPTNAISNNGTPTLILGVPLFDIAFVGIVRVVTGKVHSLHEWLAYTGKDHLHHRFAALGLTKTQSVLLVFFVASTLGLSAILLKDATPYETALVLIQAACILALVAVLEGVGRGRPRG